MATEKQRRAFDTVGVNGGNISKAMVTAGYSKEVSKRTDKLTRTKGWKELMDKHFPDSELAALHKKLLKKKEVIVVSDGAREGSHLEWTGQPHTDSLKALETAYKLKSRFVEGESGNKTLILMVTGETAQRYGIKPTQLPENSSS